MDPPNRLIGSKKFLNLTFLVLFPILIVGLIIPFVQRESILRNDYVW